MGGLTRDPNKLRESRRRKRHSERGKARAQRQAQERLSNMSWMNVVRILAGWEPIAPSHAKRLRGARDS
jgi:hypothetical protein